MKGGGSFYCGNRGDFNALENGLGSAVMGDNRPIFGVENGLFLGSFFYHTISFNSYYECFKVKF